MASTPKLNAAAAPFTPSAGQAQGGTPTSQQPPSAAAHSQPQQPVQRSMPNLAGTRALARVPPNATYANQAGYTTSVQGGAAGGFTHHAQPQGHGHSQHGGHHHHSHHSHHHHHAIHASHHGGSGHGYVPYAPLGSQQGFGGVPSLHSHHHHHHHHHSHHHHIAHHHASHFAAGAGHHHHHHHAGAHMLHHHGHAGATPQVGGGSAHGSPTLPNVPNAGPSFIGAHPTVPHVGTLSPQPQLQSKPAIVILVTGYHGTGKTTIAKRLAEEKKFKYISGREDDSMGELQQQIDEHTRQRRPNMPFGFVLDDFIGQNAADFYYLVEILKDCNLHLDRVVYLDADLDELQKRRTFESGDRIDHPVSFEVCSTLMSGTDFLFHVVCGGRGATEIYKEVLEEVNRINSGKQPALDLPPVELCPELPLVISFDKFAKVRKAVAESCKCSASTFPGSFPRAAMEYGQFARYFEQLKSYHVSFSYEGEQVLVVLVDGEVFVYMHNMSAIYQLNRESPSFSNAAAAAAAAAATAASAVNPSGSVEAVFDAVFTLVPDKKIYRIFVTDLVYLRGSLGCNMLWTERRREIESFFAGEGGDPFFLVAPAASLAQIGKLTSSIPNFSNGLIFTHAGGYKIGCGDVLNFFYRFSHCASKEVRIWNARIGDVVEGKGKTSQTWIFDGMVLGEDSEEELLGEVRIPMDVVENEVLNDGNIIAVERMPHPKPLKGPQSRGTAVNNRAAMVFKFVARRHHKIHPTSRYFIDRHATWALEILVQACEKVPFKDVMPQSRSAVGSPTAVAAASAGTGSRF